MKIKIENENIKIQNTMALFLVLFLSINSDILFKVP